MYGGSLTLQNLPLRREATFAARDAEGVSRYVAETSLHTLRLTTPKALPEIAHWRWSLGSTHLDLVNLDCGSEFYIRRVPDTSRYLFQLPIAGTCELQSGRSVASARPGQMIALNPNQEALKHWVGPCTQMMVQVDRRAIEKVLTAELGHECHDMIKFDQSIHDEAIGHALGSVLRSLWQDLADNPLLHQWRLTRSLERNLLVAILGIVPHNYSDEFNSGATQAAPYYVKRAEEYIRENVREPIEIEQLVAVSGVSSRSLYYGFRRWRGTTPMSYLRNLRLNLARDALKHARSNGNNVTRVALGVGYDHLSRFSKDYRQRFGESPSFTMLQGE